MGSGLTKIYMESDRCICVLCLCFYCHA